MGIWKIIPNLNVIINICDLRSISWLRQQSENLFVFYKYLLKSLLTTLSNEQDQSLKKLLLAIKIYSLNKNSIITLLPIKRKIRIKGVLNKEKKIVTIYKDKRFQSYFDREISGRKSGVHFLNVPKIFDVDENLCFFTEELICGKSMTEILETDKQKALTYLNKTSVSLIEMFYSEWSEISVEAYTLKLEQQIEDLICMIDAPDLKNTLLELVKDLKENATKELDEVRVGLSHGDLSYDNIIVDISNQMWLIDWERFGKWSLGYDFFVLNRKTQLDQYFSKEEVNTLRFNWFRDIKKFSILKIKAYQSIYLLELLGFQSQYRYFDNNIDFKFLNKWIALVNKHLRIK